MNSKLTVKYYYFDPTKNYTILVESPFHKTNHKEIAKKLMEIEKEAEQVGFIKYDKNNNISLRMAGGEFCGNATMCAGVYAAINDKIFKEKINNNNEEISFIENNSDINKNKINKKVLSEALNKYIDVDIEIISNKSFSCSVNMPRAKSIEKIKLPNNNVYTIVNYDGISHIIIENDLYKILDKSLDNNINIDKKYFENIIKKLCDNLNLPSLGIIFYDNNKKSIKPLIYVKNADTLYWENSCASGSIAVYEYLLYKNMINASDEKNNHLYLKQPCDDYIEVYLKKDNIYLQSVVDLIYTKEVLI